MTSLVPALARKAVNTVRWELESRLAKARDRRTVETLRTANVAATNGGENGEPEISFLKLYEVAHIQHRPEGLFSEGSVVLFKASSGNGDVDDMPYQDIFGDLALGWGKRVADTITLVTVPGGHSSALQEPHVATLAPLFQKAVDSALHRAEFGDDASEDHDVVAAE